MVKDPGPTKLVRAKGAIWYMNTPDPTPIGSAIYSSSNAAMQCNECTSLRQGAHLLCWRATGVHACLKAAEAEGKGVKNTFDSMGGRITVGFVEVFREGVAGLARWKGCCIERQEGVLYNACTSTLLICRNEVHCIVHTAGILIMPCCCSGAESCCNERTKTPLIRPPAVFCYNDTLKETENSLSRQGRPDQFFSTPHTT